MLNPLKSAIGRREGPLEFAKMAGGGNDFVVIDNRVRVVTEPVKLTRAICTRRLSVGADGLILIETSARATFRMRYFNSDGSIGEFCANGTRCAARFAFMNVIAPRRMSIETDAGVVGAEIVDRNVELALGPPRNFVENRPITLSAGASISGSSILVGVPHYVILSDRLWDLDIEQSGHEIRFHRELAPAGANIDWVQIGGRQSIAVRTYERGVEGETLSCGSGVVASVAVGANRGMLDSPVDVLTRSGIRYEVGWRRSTEGGAIASISLKGDARVVYRAELTPETVEGFDPDWVRSPGRSGADIGSVEPA